MGLRVERKRTRYQIVANTGETIGTPLKSRIIAEEYIKELRTNKKFLEETCPDSNLDEITDFAIELTKDY